MSEGRFENIEACVFDAYGTLLDFNSAAKRAKDTLGNNANALSSIWRQKALVQRSRIRRASVFEVGYYACLAWQRTESGRPHASMRLRTAQPMATSVC
jgi:FMN phosphatase YigB (HAD superfamily)